MGDILDTRPVNPTVTNRIFDIALRESELGGQSSLARDGADLLSQLTTAIGSRDRDRAYYPPQQQQQQQQQQRAYAPTASLFADDDECDLNYDRRQVSNIKYLNARKEALANNNRHAGVFKQLERSQKLVESNYYKTNGNVTFQLNQFWLDYVRRDRTKKFLSNNIIFATSNQTEMALALALLDLPLRSNNDSGENNEITPQGGSSTVVIKARETPQLIFQKVLKQSQVESGEGILVSQTFFDPFDRYHVSKGERIEKTIRDEFLIQKIYGAKLVITNVSSNKKRCSLLTQIPVGSIAVSNGNIVTKSHFFDLEPYRTTTPPIEYQFYFPSSGQFPHFPAHVIQDEVGSYSSLFSLSYDYH